MRARPGIEISMLTRAETCPKFSARALNEISVMALGFSTEEFSAGFTTVGKFSDLLFFEKNKFCGEQLVSNLFFTQKNKNKDFLHPKQHFEGFLEKTISIIS